MPARRSPRARGRARIAPADGAARFEGSAEAAPRERDSCGVGFFARASGEPGNDILLAALEALTRLTHRGAASGDNSGDGAGLLLQVPKRFLVREAQRLGLPLADDASFGVGMFFLPRDATGATRARDIVLDTFERDRLPFLGWRDVPVDPAALGPSARASCPVIRQAFVGRPERVKDDEVFERELFLARREIERRAWSEGLGSLYVVSLSCRTVVYKALLTGRQLPAFYADFHAPDLETALAVFHQRFSTNTLPSWALAQPFRLLAHNGEINTLWGNRNAMTMRGPLLASPIWGRRVERLRNVIWAGGSDSASLDNAMELLVRSGRSPVHAAMMLVPQAWEKYPDVRPDVRAFYEYHQCLIEPWDGPAALSFSDGVVVAAAVDRNGLRPCRFKVRRDGVVMAGSEVGLCDWDPRDVVESGKVGPGELLVVDTARGRVVRNPEAKREVAARKPYARWVARNMVTLQPAAEPEVPARSDGEPAALQVLFGWGAEDLSMVLDPMLKTGAEPVFSMGDDAPLPVLSRFPSSLYDYFRQRFAQVTNPPIDSLRETMVMSLRMHLGPSGSPLLEEKASFARVVRLEHPVLLEGEMAGLLSQSRLSTALLPALWPPAAGTAGLLSAIRALCEAAEHEVRKGTRILVLSDREAGPERAPIPMLLAVGAVRRHLVRLALRAQVGLVAEAGDAFDVHHLACLFGYGAEAVHPWLALRTVRARGAGFEGGPDEAVRTYRAAAEKGLLKVLSKMGIATLSSYCGAQTFDALGLGNDVVDLAFSGTASPIGGIGLAELAEDGLERHRAAFPAEGTAAPADLGRVRFRREAEEHAWSPLIVGAVQRSAKSGDPSTYAAFLEKVGTQRPVALRDLLAFRPTEPVPQQEVEPAAAILPRFIASAMSLGALSPEAHAALAVAMNRIGARSNSGEGGEDPATWRDVEGATRADNRIKQVASGRFGVTTEYLVRAEELEIKIVQGAKPGEGGQLPGHKVTELIARLRHAVPGVTLISPPPHHDIYSIEDLAQLIHDLKTVNPRARVGVKLVAEAGVGTIAAGVAKAFADYVLVAGHAGGTGASPLSSIKHAGSPWELGLAETQAALVRNGLRHRVEVRVDGGLRTGQDVVVAALLGAESFGFGTAPLVALGCVMARQCHLNSCPTGVTTQREDLRAKFRGTPEAVVAYFTALAEDVRGILASLGFRTLDEAIGRSDLLCPNRVAASPRAGLLDLSCLFAPVAEEGAPRRRSVERNRRPGLVSLDAEILLDLLPSLEAGEPFAGSYPIRNHHLTVGARIAGTIAERSGDAGLPPGRVRLRFVGSAGQSFGAWAMAGMHLDLEGEANDTVGKGLCGGEITIRPFRQAAHAEATHENQILGNTALYGATAGFLLAAGQAGDRFAVRNSGAVAVVEGTGNHACEYMTGGLVAILGRAGRNFGAGMSNGVAYVLDEEGTFPARVNRELVEIVPLDDEDAGLLKRLVAEHRRRTLSPRARTLLADWERYLPLFRKVVPRDERAAERVASLRRAVREKLGDDEDPPAEAAA